MGRTELRVDLAAARTTLLEVVARLGPEDWTKPSRNAAWTARDVLAHLVAAESGMVGRIKRGLGGDPKLPPGFDLDVYNRRQVEKRREKPAAALLEELTATRVEVLDLLDRLSDAELALPVEHPINAGATIAWIFGQIARHEREHAADLVGAPS